MPAQEPVFIAPATDGVRRLLSDRGFVALGATLAAWVMTFAVVAALRALAPQTPVLALFMLLVVVVAMLEGAGPGVLATALSLAAILVLGAPDGSAAPAALIMFLAAGILSSVGGEWVVRRRLRDERASQTLLEREALLRSIFDSAPDAMIVIDEKGIVQSYSAAAQRMFGWSAVEILGRNVSTLMPAPFRQEHDGYLHRYLSTSERRIIGIGRIVAGERKDGSTFPMELNVGEVRSPHGRFFTGFVRDLTERQETEARLQELQSELVHISRLSAMGEMASALAHELNQPLSAISNYLSGARRLLEQTPNADSRSTEAIGKAAEQAIRAGDIIRRLRDFIARGESERSVESLTRLVQEACTLALVGAKEYGVRVQYRLDPRVERVIVDRVQIQQVLLNLVRNALDAMRGQPGRRELVVSTEQAADSMARVSVADTGPGLDPDAAARLFQPFVTTKAQGMGVGLSISKTIVEAHGGQIWHERNPEGGAIFRFTMRLANGVGEAENGKDER
ncbi:MAG: PAS domain S-box protein [Hyphomonadaceae bacterium]|nr:PAS domain S-box protein [Hyphomonadaceae bacterium]